MSDGQRRPMVISPLWAQAVALTFMVGFAILGYLALRVYQDHAPVPGRVVHLWVEDFRELLTPVMVAYIFVLLSGVSERTATRVIYFDVILYSVGGVVGTMHHLYFSGTPEVHMGLGAFFSAAEVIPLTFLTVEAWTFLHLGARQEVRGATPFPHRWRPGPRPTSAGSTGGCHC